MKPKKFNLFNDEGTLIYSSSKEIYADLHEYNNSVIVEIDVNKKGLINYNDGKKVVPTQFSRLRLENNYIIGLKKGGAVIFNKDGKTIFENIQDYFIISPYLLSVVFEDGEYAILNNQLEILIKGIKAASNLEFLYEGFQEDRCRVENKDSKYGYIDLDCKLIIDPIFDFARDFENGRAVVGFEVNYHRKFGLINKKGEFILEPLYDDVRIGTSKISIIKTDNKYGLIDEKGDIIVQPIYDYIDNFIEADQNNFAKVKVDGKYGLINKSGDVIIEPVYEDIKINDKDVNAIVKNNEKYGVFNLEGNELIPCIYDEIDSFYPDETELTYYKVKNDGKIGLISEENQIIIPLFYKYSITLMSPNLIKAYNGTDKWDIFKLDGKKLFEEEFKEIKNIGENLILCDDILINKEGKILFKDVHIDRYSSFDGLTEDCLINISINHEYGYINKYGEIKIKPQFYLADPFHNGYAIVTNKEEKKGVIDQTGKFIIDPIYYNIREIDNNLWGKWIVKREEGGYAIISKDGEIIFEENEGNLEDCRAGGLLENTVNGTIGFINLNGETVIKPVYDEIKYFSQGVCPVSINGYWGLINDQGKEIVAPSFRSIYRNNWGKLNILESND